MENNSGFNRYFTYTLCFLVPREEDTTSSMYPRPESSPVQTQPVSGQKKVDLVCDALRSTMESMGPNKSVIQIFIYNRLLRTLNRRRLSKHNNAA